LSCKTVLAKDQQSIQTTEKRDDHMNSEKESRDSLQQDVSIKGTTSIGPVEIPVDNNVSEQLESVTSANILCNYMKKIEYLKEVIRNMAFIPRYVEENLEYLNVADLHTISFPMTCFCDIPLTKIKNHMEVYGEYGVAIKKKVGIERDVQPILYLNNSSRLKSDLSEAISKLLNEDPISPEWRILPDAMLSVLLYSKPIAGYMSRDEWDKPRRRLFKDECEWRYIPSVSVSMPLIIPQDDSTKKGRKYYSKALAQDKSTWFSFQVDEIEYIIVPNEATAIEMISAIRSMKGKTQTDKHKLISKIEIADKFNANLV